MAQSPTSSGLLRHGILPLGVVGAVVLTASVCRPAPWQPRSLDEVFQAVGQLQLLVRCDTANGQIGSRLIISEGPVTYEQTSEIIMDRWRPSSGPLMVALYLKPPIDTGDLKTDPDHYALWGNYLLYGEPELVKRLTSHQLSTARRWF